MPRQLILIDVDNTIYDSGSRLTHYHKDYNPHDQLIYKLTDEQVKTFDHPDFYANVKDINQDLLDFLKTLSPEVEIGFYSQSQSAEAHLRKTELVNYIANQLTKLRFHGIKEFRGYDKDRERTWFESQRNKAEVVTFIDDAPHRLEMLEELGFNYYKMAHPYNEQFIKCSKQFTPNYRR